jgi:hypothetical protein
MPTSLFWHLLWPLASTDDGPARHPGGAAADVESDSWRVSRPRGFEPARAPNGTALDKYEALAARRRRAQIAARRALGE